MKFRDCKLLSIVLVVSTQLVNFTIHASPAIQNSMASIVTLSPAEYAFLQPSQCKAQGANVQQLLVNGVGSPSMSCTYKGTTTYYYPPAPSQSPAPFQSPFFGWGGYNSL